MKAKTLIALTLLSASVPALAATDVQVTTNLGQFTLQLNDAKAPITTQNFLRYVDNGSYVGSIFHRVIPGFMAQGGGFNEKMQRLPTFEPIKNESNNGLKNLTATIAMARTSDPDSATRQFFINYKDNTFLDSTQNKPGYAVFGKIISGFDVVQKMTSIPTESLPNGMQNVPQTPIVITAMKVIPSKATSSTNTTISTAQ